MARIDSLLAIVADQGANELRIGSDREPRMFAYGTPKKLNIPPMPEQTLRDLLGEILTPERAASLQARRPVELTHEAGPAGSFHVTLTAREGGGLDILFKGGKKGAAPSSAPVPPPAAAPASPSESSSNSNSSGAPSERIAAQVRPAALPTTSLALEAITLTPLPPLVALVARAASMGASDVHLLDGEPPALRTAGVLTRLEDQPVVDLSLFLQFHGDDRARILAGESADSGAEIEDVARVRLHVYATRGGLAAAVRLLPRTPPTLASLDIPVPLDDLAFAPHGLVLVCGATGSGKSTTLAALAQEALRRRSILLVTLEDPIEFALSAHRQSLVRRRHVGHDTPNFASGLRDALREDPDVLLLGEMRDPETIALALTAAETGHLVLSSIHSRSAASAIERIVDSYPAERQGQIRTQLADSLRAIVVQRLLPKARGGGRTLAVEVLRGTHAVASLIREGKGAQLPTLLQSGKREGMLSLERSLADRVLSGDVKVEDARAAANDQGSLATYLAKP
jgi:twitching motility protein PilT